MRDGTRLAADLHMPDAPGPFPLILEYIPYRKDDQAPYQGTITTSRSMGISAAARRPWHGASEGVNYDEYVPQEQEDGYDAIEWLAQQPWCDGQIAMFGCPTAASSVTRLRPTSRRTSRRSSRLRDRRPLHRRLPLPWRPVPLLLRLCAYGAWMIAMNALPPYPEFSGADWAEIWEQHLEHNAPYMLTWMEQQVDGPYWRPGSLRGQYEKVHCPTVYHRRLARRLPEPDASHLCCAQGSRTDARADGPWNHSRPDAAIPGPRSTIWMRSYAGSIITSKGFERRSDTSRPCRCICSATTAQPDRLSTSGEWRGETTGRSQAASERDPVPAAANGRLDDPAERRQPRRATPTIRRSA